MLVSLFTAKEKTRNVTDVVVPTSVKNIIDREMWNYKETADGNHKEIVEIWQYTENERRLGEFNTHGAD